jgi:hypothetical protein
MVLLASVIHREGMLEVFETLIIVVQFSKLSLNLANRLHGTIVCGNEVSHQLNELSVVFHLLITTLRLTGR